MSQSNNPSSRKQSKRGKKRNAADLSPQNKLGNPRGAKRQRMNDTVRASIQTLLAMSSDDINKLPEELRQRALELREHRNSLTNTVDNNRNSNNSNQNNQNHQANQTNNHSNRNQNVSRPATPAPPKPDLDKESDDEDKEEEEEKELEVEVPRHVQRPRANPPSHRQRNNQANHSSRNPSQIHAPRPSNRYVQPQPQRQQMPRQPQTFQLQPPSRAHPVRNGPVQPSASLLYQPRPRAEEPHVLNPSHNLSETYPPNGRFIDARIFVPKQEEKVTTRCSCCCKMIWLILIAIIAIPLLMAYNVLNIGNVGNGVNGSKYCDTGSTQIKLLKDYGQCIPCPKNAVYCTNGQAKCKDITYWIDTEKNECVKKSGYQMMELMKGIVDSAHNLYSEKLSVWLSMEAWKLKFQEVRELEFVDFCKQYEMEVMVTFFILTWYLPALRVLIIFLWTRMILPTLNNDDSNKKDMEQIEMLIRVLSYFAPIMFAYDIWSRIVSFID